MKITPSVNKELLITLGISVVKSCISSMVIIEKKFCFCFLKFCFMLKNPFSLDILKIDTFIIIARRLCEIR